MRFSRTMVAMAIGMAALAVNTQSAKADDGPYKVLKTVKVGGAGRWDYVFADADGRRLYVPRTGGQGGGSSRVDVYNLDTLEAVGKVDKISGVHGVAVDPKTGHGFSSSGPVVMFDTKTLETIKTIKVDGRPDGILFDPGSDQVFVLSHSAPNVTVLNSNDGSIVGTIDLGGAPEEAATDGAGHVYIDIEDKDQVAVIDAKARTVTTKYELGGKGGGPAGLAIDAKNHVLFSFCHDPATCVVMNADDGKILATLPIGSGVDAAEFNPNTMEAFSSQGDSTLTVIKEKSPTEFEVEQNVKTPAGARTSTLDTKTGQIYLITAEMGAPTSRPATNPTAGGNGGRRNGGGGGGGRGRGGQMVPDSFMIVVVGK